MGVESDGPQDRAILPKAGVDLLVNVMSLLAFAGLAITGLFFMEEGHGPAKQLHELLGYLMVGLVAVHVVRHSRWIASVAAGKLLGDASSRRRTWAALVLATFAFVAIATVGLLSGGRGENGAGHESHRRANHVDER
jgi:cytochrome bd-type quinol oxidase subunit 2